MKIYQYYIIFFLFYIILDIVTTVFCFTFNLGYESSSVINLFHYLIGDFYLSVLVSKFIANMIVCLFIMIFDEKLSKYLLIIGIAFGYYATLNNYIVICWWLMYGI